MKKMTVKGIINGELQDIQCSQLVLGSGDFFSKEIEDVYMMMDEFVSAGGNFLDTAHQYIQGEEIIGKWLKLRGNRDQLKIMTKGAHPDDGEPGNRLNPKSIEKDLLESLDRLGTNYIDLYALHRDDESVPVGPIMEALNKHIKQGQIHAIGASNWKHARIQAANDYARENGLVEFTFSSPNLSLAKANEPRWPGCVSADETTVAWHEGNNIPLLSWSAQAGGFFSGNFSEDKRDDEEMVKVYYSKENWERYRRAEQLATQKNATTIQVALAYVLNQTFQTAAIIGPSTKEELKSSIEGSQIKLTTQEVEWLDLIV